MPVVEDKPVDNAADWGFGSVNESPAPAKIIEPESNVSSKEQEYASEGDGWTWEYQPEEPVAEEVAGKEGQDWEWEYEEIPEDEQTVIDENPQEVTPQEQIVQSSEIIASKDFELILVGADNDEEEDPYFYTVNSVG